MDVPKMPTPHAEHGIARDSWRCGLAPALVRDRDGDARGVVCQGHGLASLDATLASVGNSHRQEQAFVLPVYPAAWPQAKKHPLVQLVFRIYERIQCLYVVRKFGLRYRQTEIAAIAAVERLERIAGLASAIVWLRNAHVTEHLGVEGPTQKLRSFFSRWSIKVSAEYYEAKEEQEQQPLRTLR
jgi:hypothetical protein